MSQKFLDIFQGEMKAYVLEETCMWMFMRVYNSPQLETTPMSINS